MAGKLELNKVVNIEPLREVIARPIERQWYGRWFRMLYKDQPEVLRKYKVTVKFSDIEVAEWYDTIQAVLGLDQRKPLRDEAFGSLAGLDNYPEMIDLQKVKEQEDQQKEMQAKQMEVMGQQAAMGGGPPGMGGAGGPPGGGAGAKLPEGMRPGDQDSPSGPGDRPGGPPAAAGGASSRQQMRNANQPGGLKPGKQGKAGKLPGGSRSLGRGGGRDR